MENIWDRAGMNQITAFRELAAGMGIEVSKEQAELFGLYQSLMLEWNGKINLTAITEESEVVSKHFLDSLTILKYLPVDPFKSIDIGAGAGFPGLPVKIIRADMSLTLLDAKEKKVKFLTEAVRRLGLVNCEALHGRAEEISKTARRESYDICFARAVADLSVLAEICLGFVQLDGLFIAMKGAEPQEEILRSEKAIIAMGGEIEAVDMVELPYREQKIAHSLIIVRKTRHTPIVFPRKMTKIKKIPLV